jgi:hypothetical protein
LEEHSEEIDSLARADRFLYEISKWVIITHAWQKYLCDSYDVCTHSVIYSQFSDSLLADDYHIYWFTRRRFKHFGKCVNEFYNVFRYSVFGTS